MNKSGVVWEGLIVVLQMLIYWFNSNKHTAQETLVASKLPLNGQLQIQYKKINAAVYMEHEV